MGPDFLSPDGQRVEHRGREGGQGRRVEKDVSGGQREQLVPEPQRQRGAQDHGVEVAGVVGNQDERGGFGQVGSAVHFEPVQYRQ